MGPFWAFAQELAERDWVALTPQFWVWGLGMKTVLRCLSA